VKRVLGTSGIAITPLILGGNVFGWTLDQAASFAVLDAFVDAGGDAIDTADVYSTWFPGNAGGESEAIIGKWLKVSGKRDRVVIATKVGGLPARFGIARETIIAACDDSLKRLQTETIDLYQLHRDDETTPPEEFLGALDALVQAGKVRATGVSNFKSARLDAALKASAALGLTRLATVQPEYNLMNCRIEANLMPLCVREGVSIIPYYGLANGYLTGKYRSAEDKAKSVRGERMMKYMEGNGPAALAALDAVAARHGATCAQIALAWVMAKPAIAAPIASATSAAQLSELMGALRVSLSADDVAELDRVSG
jgi:aryl-alcohol dehydrogenase (NADP+)